MKRPTNLFSFVEHLIIRVFVLFLLIVTLIKIAKVELSGLWP